MELSLTFQHHFHASLLFLMYSLSFIGFGENSCIGVEGKVPQSSEVHLVETQSGLENTRQEAKSESIAKSEMASQDSQSQEKDRWLKIAIALIVLNQAVHLFCFGLLLFELSRSSTSVADSTDRLPTQQPQIIYGALGLNQVSYGGSWHEIRDRESRSPILEKDLPF
ncbi:MAG: hypothetical protein J0M26_18060 [Planctomycetes bacterium]|nr:hypothetical protein [Planctomycetota bacterium]